MSSLKFFFSFSDLSQYSTCWTATFWHRLVWEKSGMKSQDPTPYFSVPEQSISAINLSYLLLFISFSVGGQQINFCFTDWDVFYFSFPRTEMWNTRKVRYVATNQGKQGVHKLRTTQNASVLFVAWPVSEYLMDMKLMNAKRNSITPGQWCSGLMDDHRTVVAHFITNKRPQITMMLHQ